MSKSLEQIQSEIYANLTPQSNKLITSLILNGVELKLQKSKTWILSVYDIGTKFCEIPTDTILTKGLIEPLLDEISNAKNNINNVFQFNIHAEYLKQTNKNKYTQFLNKNTETRITLDELKDELINYNSIEYNNAVKQATLYKNITIDSCSNIMNAILRTESTE